MDFEVVGDITEVETFAVGSVDPRAAAVSPCLRLGALAEAQGHRPGAPRRRHNAIAPRSIGTRPTASAASKLKIKRFLDDYTMTHHDPTARFLLCVSNESYPAVAGGSQGLSGIARSGRGLAGLRPGHRRVGRGLSLSVAIASWPSSCLRRPLACLSAHRDVATRRSQRTRLRRAADLGR